MMNDDWIPVLDHWGDTADVPGWTNRRKARRVAGELRFSTGVQFHLHGVPPTRSVLPLSPCVRFGFRLFDVVRSV